MESQGSCALPKASADAVWQSLLYVHCVLAPWFKGLGLRASRYKVVAQGSGVLKTLRAC